MKTIIALFTCVCVMFIAASAFAGKAETKVDWQKGTLTVYLPTDLEGLEPYAHIWTFNQDDKTRQTYEQVFADNVIAFSKDDDFLIVTVSVGDDVCGEKIIRIWANNDGGESLYCNPNDYYSFPSLNTATGVKHYNHEFLLDLEEKTIKKVPRGTEMDKFSASN